ncbi:MAG: hypothetical protein M3Z03_16725 [Actinomycetota bacterium]|nr:hypothetical protein [Actinomycetota bacterium]
MATTESTEQAALDHGPAGALLDAICERDMVAVEALLATGATLRAVLPAKIVEAEGRDEVMPWLRKWYDGPVDYQLLDRSMADVAGRARLSWQMRASGHPVNGDPQPHQIEQTVFCDEDGGTVTRIDLLCSGFRPVD